MAIATDIVLGVSRAANTERQRAAEARLQALSEPQAASAGEAAGKPVEADAVWDAVVRKAAQEQPQSAHAVIPPAAPGTKEANASAKNKEAYVKFEALLVQNMIEAMMPKDMEAVFGSGTAGNVWKSMLAEKVAMQIAESGALGIAKEIAGGEAARIAAGKHAKDDSA
jgi:hypothetical protein